MVILKNLVQHCYLTEAVGLSELGFKLLLECFELVSPYMLPNALANIDKKQMNYARGRIDVYLLNFVKYRLKVTAATIIRPRATLK